MFFLKKKCQIKWSLIRNGFISAGGVVVYIVIVSLVMQNGEKIFGSLDNFAGPVIFLLLFVFSTLVTGGLIFGFPVWHYLEGDSKSAWRQFFYNTFCLFLIIVFIITARMLLA